MTDQGDTMWERMRGFIMFIVAVGILIVFLKALNWVPGILQEGLSNTYGSIEEVESKLHFREILIPSYYPQGLQWPPALITAQTKPYAMVQMECTRQQDNKVSLIISQTALPYPDPKVSIEMIKKNEPVQYTFKGRNAALVAGLCGNNEPCSRISWNEPRYHIDVIMLSLPSEIVKIAESMVSK